MKQNLKAAMLAGGIAIGAAGLAGAAAYGVTKLLVQAAIDREQPEIIKKATRRITGTYYSAEFLAEWDRRAEAVAEKPHEVVTITANDGTHLVGHFFSCENPKRVIVAMHGWRGRWNKDFAMILDFFLENGCCVLCAEQRGQGTSGGDSMGFGLTERYDCRDWAHWAVLRCGDKLPIYLCGISMGATTVLMASGLDLPKSVHGVMADCGFTSPDAEWKHVMENNLHLPYRFHSRLADMMFSQKNSAHLTDYSTVDALRETELPVLFVHGTSDFLVPVEMTYENYQACRSPKRLLIVPGADHGVSYCVERERYEQAVKDFWRDFD